MTTSAPLTWLARLWPAALLAGTAALMMESAAADPFDPTLTGTARYGHNHEGALGQMLTWCACEFVALELLLAPGWSDRLWRAIVALLLFGAWALFSLVMTMHQGLIVALHALWLIAVCVMVLATLIVRAVRSSPRARARAGRG
jgi:hypothetical protein